MIMFQSVEFRLATLTLFAGLAAWGAPSPAWAFSQENLRGGADSSAFSDPGDQDFRQRLASARPQWPDRAVRRSARPVESVWAFSGQ
jgi:hypothetical protein